MSLVRCRLSEVTGAYATLVLSQHLGSAPGPSTLMRDGTSEPGDWVEGTRWRLIPRHVLLVITSKRLRRKSVFWTGQDSVGVRKEHLLGFQGIPGSLLSVA